LYTFQLFELTLINTLVPYSPRGRCGRDRMVVGFTTTYAISNYHH